TRPGRSLESGRIRGTGRYAAAGAGRAGVPDHRLLPVGRVRPAVVVVPAAVHRAAAPPAAGPASAAVTARAVHRRRRAGAAARSPDRRAGHQELRWLADLGQAGRGAHPAAAGAFAGTSGAARLTLGDRGAG